MTTELLRTHTSQKSLDCSEKSLLAVKSQWHQW